MKFIKMQSENKYLGDEKFIKFLEHYKCPTPLNVVKMKFMGAMCTPYVDLRPTDVISSFWEENNVPRLETKEEADLFFKFFMGLWDELFDNVKANKIDLSSYKKPEDADDFAVLCQSRYEEIEYGFVEGFWAGQENLKLPTYLAELMDSISQMAEVYMTLARKVENASIDDEVWKHFVVTDKVVKKAIAFLVENSVLPRIDSLQRTVN
jgi:hypothetical protein